MRQFATKEEVCITGLQSVSIYGVPIPYRAGCAMESDKGGDRRMVLALDDLQIPRRSRRIGLICVPASRSGGSPGVEAAGAEARGVSAGAACI